MSVVTPPRAGVILGFVKVQGQDTPVTISDEYARWLTALMARVGGVKCIDLDELAQAAMPPNPAFEEIQRVAEEAARAQLAQIPQIAEEAARLQVVQLLSDLPPGDDSAGQIASLREDLALSRRPKRVIPGAIPLSGFSGTWTASPAITGPAELRHLGVSTSSASAADASVSISLSGSTVTASRGGNSSGATVSFEITEYYP